MTLSNEFHANIELQHIYLESKAERYHSLGQYLEAYYCYRHQLTTRQGKPDWQQIFTFASPSLAAKACTARKQTVKEMVVPLSVMIGKLKTLVRDDELSIEAIADLLDRELDYVILSRSEWQQLCELGLENRMPADYYRVDSDKFSQPMSRFTMAGIQF